LHSLFSGKDRDLKIQRQRVLYRGLTAICLCCKNDPKHKHAGGLEWEYIIFSDTL